MNTISAPAQPYPETHHRPVAPSSDEAGSHASRFTPHSVLRIPYSALPTPHSAFPPAAPPLHHSIPQYSLRRGLGFWEVTFAGKRAVFKHEQGAFYVAHLLLNPPEQAIHGLALAMRATIAAGKSVGATEIANPANGEMLPVRLDSTIQQRSLGLDDAEAEWNLRRKQCELEYLLDDAGTSDQLKEEILRELEAIYDHQKKNPWATRTTAQKTADSVARAIKRLHQHLAKSVDAAGNPDPVLRAFADHIKECILTPSGRGYEHGGFRPADRIGGFFTYERPPEISWEADASDRTQVSVARISFHHQQCEPAAECIGMVNGLNG